MASTKKTQNTEVKLHPLSLKHLSKGHPWIIQDSFTDRFPAKAPLLYTDHEEGTYTLINDSKHPKIKARLWSKELVSLDDFNESFTYRLKDSFLKRKQIIKRENFYLLFGEADQVPGLFIQWLKEGILIQSYSSFWKKKQKEIVPVIREMLIPKGLKWILWQDRDFNRENNFKPLWGKVPSVLNINEFDVTYKLHFDEAYDIGIYTDMSGIRENARPLFKDSRVLNLYSYTGAWSLYALKQGASEVISADLSEKYLRWLDENLSLNSLEESGEHRSMIGDCEKSLQKLVKENKKVDLIICDPPSFSSDGAKTTSAFKVYERLLPLFNKVLSEKGKAICFLNTHSITRKKFTEHMEKCGKKNSFKIREQILLTSDCPRLPGFPEGDYLKGLLLTK
jgi:23S rRNA (cytosine1962-C5)-methyltransferase